MTRHMTLYNAMAALRQLKICWIGAPVKGCKECKNLVPVKTYEEYMK